MIIFSSSPYFKKIYETLSDAGFKIDCLITESPKPAGRGLRLTKNPAHEFADEVGLSTSFSQPIAGSFDLGLIHAYGKIIPQNVIDKFKHGILNIHPSLLPKYRGASPIISPILNGDKKTGYSIILTDKKCDTGDIVAQQEIDISDNDTHDTLREKIMTLAINDLPRVLKDYLEGKIKLRPQDESQTSMTSKVKKSDGQILERESVRSAYNKIRAFSDWPKAFFIIDGKRIIVHSAIMVGEKIDLISVQVEGKNKISFLDFKHGYASLLTKLPKFVRITEE